MHEGFARVTSPGRLEVMGTQPLILLDGAHNAAGAAALARALRDEFAPQPRTLVVGLLREKDPTEMLAALEVTGVEHLVCTRPPTPVPSTRSRWPTPRSHSASTPIGSTCCPTRPTPSSRARAVTAADGQIVVTGSLYAVGAARAELGS